MNAIAELKRSDANRTNWGDVSTAELPPRMQKYIPDQYLKWAKLELQKYFQVEDLSIREQISLRTALQSALKLFLANQTVIQRPEAKASRQIDPVREAVLL